MKTLLFRRLKIAAAILVAGNLSAILTRADGVPQKKPVFKKVIHNGILDNPTIEKSELSSDPMRIESTIFANETIEWEVTAVDGSGTRHFSKSPEWKTWDAMTWEDKGVKYTASPLTKQTNPKRSPKHERCLKPQMKAFQEALAKGHNAWVLQAADVRLIEFLLSDESAPESQESKDQEHKYRLNIGRGGEADNKVSHNFMFWSVLTHDGTCSPPIPANEIAAEIGKIEKALAAKGIRYDPDGYQEMLSSIQSVMSTPVIPGAAAASSRVDKGTHPNPGKRTEAGMAADSAGPAMKADPK